MKLLEKIANAKMHIMNRQTGVGESADMSLAKRNLMLAVVASLVIYLGFVFYGMHSIKAIERAQTKDLKAVYLTGQAVYLDDVLTGSARMASLTGNLSWEARYKESKPELITVLKSLRAFTPKKYQEEGAAVSDKASQVMAAIERQAFDLVRQGKQKDAQALLAGDTYLEQKQIYSRGMDRQKVILSEQFRRSLNAERFVFKFFLLIFFLIQAGVVYLWRQSSDQFDRWQTAMVEKDVIIAEKSREIKDIETSLDRVISERTEPLKRQNEQLQKEIEEHRRTEAELTEKLTMAAKPPEPEPEPEPQSFVHEHQPDIDGLFREKDGEDPFQV